MTLRLTLAAAAMAALVAGPVVAAQSKPKPQAKAETWTGKISDSMCGADHGKNGGTPQKDHDCAVKCVKNGAKYVLVVGDKIYKIANQKFAALSKDAGYPVQVTGRLAQDTVTVTKVVVQK
jgi:opacity protein-like surface antigen